MGGGQFELKRMGIDKNNMDMDFIGSQKRVSCSTTFIMQQKIILPLISDK